MTRARSANAGGAREPARGGVARAIGDVLPATLRGMGVPSRAQSQRVRQAWATVSDPAWAGRTEPVSLAHGTLFVGVSSASLRDELSQFHAKRLLDAIGRALPTERVVALRFVPAEGRFVPAEGRFVPAERPPVAAEGDTR